MQHQPRTKLAGGLTARIRTERIGNRRRRKPASGGGGAYGTCRKLDICARIRHDSRDAVMRDAVVRGAGLTRRRVIRS
jgi:hypothetical protein